MVFNFIKEMSDKLFGVGCASHIYNNASRYASDQMALVKLNFEKFATKTAHIFQIIRKDGRSLRKTLQIFK